MCVMDELARERIRRTGDIALRECTILSKTGET